jgi:hypothetical protein
MKFGGTSVATLDRIRRAAKRVGREVANGYDVIVIVSAMAGKTNELVGWVEETSPLLRRARIRRRGLLGRERDRRADGADAAGNGRARAQLAGLAGAGADDLGPCLGPDRGDPDRQHHGEVRRRHARGGGRGLPGHQPRGPDHHAGPGRVGHHRRGLRRRLRGGALRHLHRCGRGLYHRPAHHHEGPQARPDRLRGDAGTGLARARRCCRRGRWNWRCATT